MLQGCVMGKGGEEGEPSSGNFQKAKITKENILEGPNTALHYISFSPFYMKYSNVN